MSTQPAMINRYRWYELVGIYAGMGCMNYSGLLMQVAEMVRALTTRHSKLHEGMRGTRCS